MDRGFGEVEYLQRLIPEWLATPVALLTQLGDVWFLSLLLLTLYWIRAADRDTLAAVGGVTLAGLALLDALKHAFALPRPDRPLLPTEALPSAIQPVYEATAFAAGYGFPSGHALMTTVVYVSLAVVLPVSTARRRFVAAGALVVAVSVSRIALGVHYLVDVAAGAGLGLLFLAATGAALRRASDRGTAAFGLAVLFAGVNLLVSPVDGDALLLLGASVGGFGGWQLAAVRRRLAVGAPLGAGLRAYPLRAVAAGAAVVPLLAVVGYDRLASALSVSGLLGLGVAAFLVLPLLTERGW